VSTLLDIIANPMTPYAAAWVAGAVFFALFMRVQWWRHPWGRHVALYTLVVEAAIGERLAHWLFGTNSKIAGVVLGWAFALVMAQRAWVQWSTSRRARRAAQEKEAK